MADLDERGGEYGRRDPCLERRVEAAESEGLSTAVTALTEMSLDRLGAFRAQLMAHEAREVGGELRTFRWTRLDVLLQVCGAKPFSGAPKKRAEGVRGQVHRCGGIGGRYAVDVDQCERALPRIGEPSERTAKLVSLSHLGGVVARFGVGEERQHLGFNGRGGTGRR